LLLLHREVGPQDLLEGVLLLCLLERVVRAVLRDRLVVHRFPGQLLDLLCALATLWRLICHPLSFRESSSGLPWAVLAGAHAGASACRSAREYGSPKPLMEGMTTRRVRCAALNMRQPGQPGCQEPPGSPSTAVRIWSRWARTAAMTCRLPSAAGS